MISIVTATPNTVYTEIGYNDFRLGSGTWNADQSYQTFTKSVGDPQLAPLVADLDNDGTNEIIVLEGNTIRLYHDKTLTIVDAFTSANNWSEPMMITADLDDDGELEIIVTSGADRYVEILGYNGTHFYQEVQHTMDFIFGVQ